MLYPPYFDPKRPMSINYGALGTIIGHEMMHLFDTKGLI
jgi:predicted metalloendopeptidase